MCEDSSTTTQSVKLDPASANEEMLRNFLVDDLIPTYFGQIGYDVKPKTEFKYDHPETIKTLEAQIADLKQKQADMDAGKGPISPLGGMLGGKTDYQKEIMALETKLAQEKSTGKEVKSYDFELNEYGKKLQEQKMEAADYQAQLQKDLMGVATKFMSGDYSITDSQKALIADSMKAIKDPVFKMLDEVNKEYEATGKNITDSLNEYMGAIKDTGLSVGAALSAVGDKIELTKQGYLSGIGEEEKKLMDKGEEMKAALTGVKEQIDKTGAESLQALEQTFAIKQTLAKKNLESLYKSQQLSVANKAAMLGRSPMDPGFQLEFLNNMAGQMEKVSLEMAEQEALAKVGLVQTQGGKYETLAYNNLALSGQLGAEAQAIAAKKTEAVGASNIAQEQLAMAKANLEATQGAKLESATSKKMDIDQLVGAGKVQTAQAKAAAEENLAKWGEQMKWNIGQAIPAAAVGMGMDVGGYQSALQQQQTANVGSGFTPVSGAQQMYFQERAAQPTTTSTTTTSTNPFSVALGAIGMGAGAAGGIMGGLGAMNTGANLEKIFEQMSVGLNK